jgi:hypothetical protein
MKARESANRVSCANNLRQLAIAAHAYENSFQRLPPNFHEDPSRSDGSHNLFYGPMVRLLPYLELDDTYKNFSFLYYDSEFPDPEGVGWPAVPNGMTNQFHCWQRNPFNQPGTPPVPPVTPPDLLWCPNPTGQTGIANQTWGASGSFGAFNCPSHPATGQNGPAILYFLDGIPGTDFPKGNPVATIIPQCSDISPLLTDPPCRVSLVNVAAASFVDGRSSYVPVLGSFVDPADGWPASRAAKYHSLFSWNENASLSRVPDGASNTLLFSEYAGFYTPPNASPGVTGWAMPSWAANAVTVLRGTCPDPNNPNCNFAGASQGGGDALGGWHTGTFQTVFADGSLHRLRLGIDQNVLLSLAGFNDGDVITTPDY